MSRFWGDEDSGDYPSHWWEIDLARALTSGRGQRMLRDIEASLRAMPERKLIDSYIVRYDEAVRVGEVCAIGAYAAYQQVKAGATWADAFAALNERWGGEQDDHWNTRVLGRSVGLARTVAVELAFQNDEHFSYMKPRQRWRAVLRWVRSQIKAVEVPA